MPVTANNFIRLLLVMLIFLLIAFSDQNQRADPFFLSEIPKTTLILTPHGTSVSSASRIAPRLMDEIRNRPLFTQSRRLEEQEFTTDKSVIMIDGKYIAIELVGTIESISNKIAAFMLEGQNTIWLNLDEHLGDWQIEDIAQNEVRLTNKGEVRLLKLRKTADMVRQTDDG